MNRMSASASVVSVDTSDFLATGVVTSLKKATTAHFNDLITRADQYIHGADELMGWNKYLAQP